MVGYYDIQICYYKFLFISRNVILSECKGKTENGYISIKWLSDSKVARWLANWDNIEAGGVVPRPKEWLADYPIQSRKKFIQFANQLGGEVPGLHYSTFYLLITVLLKWHCEIER
jgi:hypothetical protein